MRACGRHAPTGLRNRALIALLYRTGLRINEALSLYPKDLELADGSVRVLNGKGGRSRTVGLNPGAAAIIERWLDARSRINLDPTGRSRLSLGGRHPVFCTLRGDAMAAAYVRVMLKRLAARAGIDKRVPRPRPPPHARRPTPRRRRGHRHYLPPTRPLQHHHHRQLPRPHRADSRHRSDAPSKLDGCVDPRCSDAVSHVTTRGPCVIGMWAISWIARPRHSHSGRARGRVPRGPSSSPWPNRPALASAGLLPGR